MQLSRSDTELTTDYKFNHSMSENQEKSKENMSKQSINKSLLCIIKLQKSIIDSYKTQLNDTNDEIIHRKENLKIITNIFDTNIFDPDDVTNMLIHHVNNSEDKEIFRNAIIFMQNKLNFVLEKVEQTYDHKEKNK
jgi:uncharacterized membrane protein YheB (UPF0754 family)